MAPSPRPLPQSWSSPSSPHHSTLQWHPAMAPSNGTTSIPPKLKLVVTLPPNYSTLQWYPTMAPSNGATSTAPCNGTLVPRPIRQSGSAPSPLLEVRTPIAIAIWGKRGNLYDQLAQPTCPTFRGFGHTEQLIICQVLEPTKTQWFCFQQKFDTPLTV